jgi:Cathepsin propeptide inhibitor domain (I29)
MKISVSSFVLLLASATSAASPSLHLELDVALEQERLESQFYVWMQDHGKMYATEEEAQLRMSIWKENHGTMG